MMRKRHYKRASSAAHFNAPSFRQLPVVGRAIEASAHFPLNCGLRFSMNARLPSR
jgi:hypothetical protein